VLSFRVLVLALAFEGALVVACLAALLLLRWRIARRKHEIAQAVEALEPALHEWLVRDGDVAGVVVALRGLPRHAAFRALARLATKLVTFERQQVLARALRHEPWVADLLRQGRSRYWWRRFDVARMLSIVGSDEDVALMTSLLADRSPAVRLVAFDAAARLTDPQLIRGELDDLPARQDAVQAYQFAALSRRPRQVAEALIPRLTPEAPLPALNAWIAAAAALADPEALRVVRDLATHPRPEVRLHVARALRRLAEPETPEVLLALLRDEDWRVRAQAARALGALRARIGIAALAGAVRDRSWWVRYRSALALAQIGGVAREALLGVAAGEDALARDMALLVAGLSPASVVEMSEV
jgi:HEAT repeat protein